MYAPETILKLKEPKSTEEKPFPYDRVKVIGQSPIHHGIRNAEWVGDGGQGVIITPLNGFGSTLDEPMGKIQRLYDVEALPEEVEAAPPVRVRQATAAGPTPEEQFAQFAEDNPSEPTTKSGRKKEPILPDPPPLPETLGPLDEPSSDSQ